MGRIYNVYVSNEDKVRVYKYRSSALQFAKRRIKKLEHEPDICIDIYEIEELPKFCKSLIARFATNNNPLSPRYHGQSNRMRKKGSGGARIGAGRKKLNKTMLHTSIDKDYLLLLRHKAETEHLTVGDWLVKNVKLS